MGSKLLLSPFPLSPLDYSNANRLQFGSTSFPSPVISISTRPPNLQFQFQTISKRSQVSRCSFDRKQDSEETIEVLRVPDQWLEPSTALQESEWLRITLHKWLDDEYCPEPTNVDISRIAADSYYRSLLEEITDLGEILLRMVRELEKISYQESFHGAFSSANAAVTLIAERIEQC